MKNIYFQLKTLSKYGKKISKAFPESYNYFCEKVDYKQAGHNGGAFFYTIPYFYVCKKETDDRSIKFYK